MESETSQSNRFYGFLAWVELNKKRLIIAGIILALLALGFAIYQWRQNQREAAASQALVELPSPTGRNQNAAAPKADDFLKLASQYSSTRAGERAFLLGAGSLFTEGKYAEAQSKFEKFLREYRNSPWTGQAAFGIAACLDAQNKMDEAIAKYQETISRYASEATADQAKLSLARLYEAKNQPKLALTQYDELARGKMSGTWSFTAREQREHLLKKHPELIATNAPPAMTATNLSGALSTNAPKASNAPATVPIPNQP